MADPYEQAFAELGQALVDLDGDGRPDVAVPTQNPMRAINRQYGPMTQASIDGYQMQPEMKTAQPSFGQQVFDGIGNAVTGYGKDAAAMALGLTRYAPQTIFASTLLDSDPVNAGEAKPGAPATDADLQAQAKQNAERRAAEPGAVEAAGNYLAKLFSKPDFTPVPKEQYRSTFDQRDPMPGASSEAEYVQAAGDRVRNSDAYKQAVAQNARRSAERLVQNAENAARQEYTRYVGRQDEFRAAREGRFDSAYQDYVRQRADEQRAYYSRPFFERNPELGVASVVVPTAIAARRYANTLTQRADDLAGIQSRLANPSTAASEMPALVRQEAQLIDLANQNFVRRVGDAAQNAAPAVAVSSTAKGLADLYDARFLPADAGAREDARKKYIPFNDRGEVDLSGVRKNLGEFAISAMLPIAATGGAPLFAKSPPTTSLVTKAPNAEDITQAGKIAADRLAMRNIDRQATIDELLADQQFKQQKALIKAKPPAGQTGQAAPAGAPAPGAGGQASLPPGGQAGQQGPQPGQAPGAQQNPPRKPQGGQGKGSSTSLTRDQRLDIQEELLKGGKPDDIASALGVKVKDIEPILDRTTDLIKQAGGDQAKALERFRIYREQRGASYAIPAAIGAGAMAQEDNPLLSLFGGAP